MDSKNHQTQKSGGFLVSLGETWSWHTQKDWPLLVLLAVFSVAGQALMNLGLTLETAAKATAMNYSQVEMAQNISTLWSNICQKWLSLTHA